MRSVSVGEIADIVMGQAPPGRACNKNHEGTPFVKAGEFSDRRPIIREWTTKPLRTAYQADVLVCVVGATAGKVNQGVDCAIGRSVAALRPRDGAVDSDFLYQFMRTQIQRLRSVAQGLAQGVITREMLAGTTLFLPPLPEQRRIAAILDHAEALRAKRRQVIACLENLEQSIFLAMFGDEPVRSFKAVSDVCVRITVGVVIKPASYYVEAGVPALRTLNIKPGFVDESELVYFSAASNDGPLAKSKLRAGDVVVSRTGRAGVSAIVPPRLHGANAIDLIIATPDPDFLDSLYLEALLNSPFGSRLVAGEQRGQIQQHFNVGSLKSAQIPVPTLLRQQEFATEIRQLRVLRDSAAREAAEQDALFASLQSRAFRGEL